jgi:hypothetical protein
VPLNPSLQTHVDDGHVAPFIQPSFAKQGFSKRKEKQNVQSKNFQQTKTQNIEILFQIVHVSALHVTFCLQYRLKHVYSLENRVPRNFCFVRMV